MQKKFAFIMKGFAFHLIQFCFFFIDSSAQKKTEFPRDYAKCQVAASSKKKYIYYSVSFLCCVVDVIVTTEGRHSFLAEESETAVGNVI